MKLTVLLIAAAVLLVVAIAYLGGQAVEQGRTTPEIAVSTTSPQYPIKEIYSIEKRVSDYLKITKVEEKTGYLEVTIELKYTAESMTKFGDAFAQAEIWTGGIAGETVKVLNQHGFQLDVLVWAYVRSGNGEAIVLGYTRYDSSSGSYTFEKYE
jgi:hypothetical protein